jgi:site-specific recombinase XerD
MLDRLLTDLQTGRTHKTVLGYRKPLRHWLRFQGRLKKPPRPAAWQPWLQDYLEFLRTHRGVGQATLEHAEADVRTFLRWQFGCGPADWSQVATTDLWAFAEYIARGVKPNYAGERLGRLRRFLSFVHLRGACPAELAAAVPKVAQFCSTPPPAILSERQRTQLLASFPRSRADGKRDYAATRCMLDLGLRGAEVVALRLQDVDWQHRRLNVPPVKTGHGRQLPLPTPVLLALQNYVRTARPKTGACDRLFVRHPRRTGQPLTRWLLKGMVARAYRRCHFPKTWSGTHRLRHTFASRLYHRGADMKPIADLLGHRQLGSTSHYTHVDIEALRALAQPWPT